MWTRTKITCTIGPACSSYEKISELVDAGMNVARLNFSHGNYDEHAEVIDNLKKVRQKKKIPLAIMLDMKGPKIRIGALQNDQVLVAPKQRILLVKEEVVGTAEKISVSPAVVIDSMEEGTTLLFDDGNFIAKVVKKTSEGALVELQNGGILKSHKGVNIPGAHLNVPALTDQDIKDLIFGCKQDVDLLAASFIRTADNILEIKKHLADQGKPEVLVIAKIETSIGVKEFDSILQVTDGIMVARGDLGVELPLKVVPRLQKMMIRKCALVSKPVITATQMLESMIKNPRPTRAEVSDVANAIYDSTSSVMLSGETAIGQYPVETVQMMKSIIEETEKDFSYESFFDQSARKDYNDVSSSVALAAVNTAYSANARAIFAFTSSGFTARLISRYRPRMPILALSSKEKVYHQMALTWGVAPVPPADLQTPQEAFTLASAFAEKQNFLQEGDLVVLTAGTPFGVSGTTNIMIVESVKHHS